MTKTTANVSTVGPEMRDAVGRTMLRLVSFPVDASDIRRWAIAVHWPERPPERYLTGPSTALVAPPDFNPFAWAPAASEPADAADIAFDDPARIEKLLRVPGPGLQFTLHGGISVDYGVPVRVGDVITSKSKLSGYQERDGRLGRMLLTTIEDSWTNQRSERVKTVRLTYIRY